MCFFFTRSSFFSCIPVSEMRSQKLHGSCKIRLCEIQHATKSHVRKRIVSRSTCHARQCRKSQITKLSGATIALTVAKFEHTQQNDECLPNCTSCETRRCRTSEKRMTFCGDHAGPLKQCASVACSGRPIFIISIILYLL